MVWALFGHADGQTSGQTKERRNIRRDRQSPPRQLIQQNSYSCPLFRSDKNSFLKIPGSGSIVIRICAEM